MSAEARLDLIDEEASAWVVLEGDRALTPEERRRLAVWRAADPRHEKTYQALLRTWSDVPVLTELGALAPAEPMAAKAEQTSRRLPTPRLALGALAAAAAVLLLLFLPSQLAEAPPAQDFATALGQEREIHLSDGSVVTLGPRSLLSVAFSRDERRVRLDGGEAFFEVAHNSARPFLVEAGPSIILVTGTKFDVRHGAGSIRVSVLEGSVQVGSADDRAAFATRLLHAGQEASITPPAAAAGSAAAAPSAPNAAVTVTRPAQPPAAWRGGRRAYENARLADLIADMNRYYAPGVRIADERVNNLRITASFKTTEIPEFLAAIGDVIPVRAVRAPDGSYRIAASH